jgi:hypothetical protein
LAHTPTLDEDEEAEREQLRAAAVQSVGFDVNISRPSAVMVMVIISAARKKEDAHAHEHGNERALPPMNPPKLPSVVDSGLRCDPTSSHLITRVYEFASCSQISSPHLDTYDNTTAPNEVLAFPSNLAQLAAHKQLSATLPKHYPPPSLLMLTLSKQWEARHVVLSSPILVSASYSHIFKSNAPDERELKRLEINEHSIVFINDEDVGGRRGVVLVGGVDVGTLRRTRI